MTARRVTFGDDLQPDEWRRPRAPQAAGGIPASAWGGSPAAREAGDAMQGAPMRGDAVRYFPVAGPTIEAYEDFRDGKPLQGIGNSLLALGDGALVYTTGGVAAAVGRGTAVNAGKMTGNAIQSQLRRRGVSGPGKEVHHTFELKGLARNVENWRNHPAFVKVLPKADHRRIHGRWGDLPKFNPLQATWVGTPTWMKTLPAGLGPRTVQGVVDLLHPKTPRREQDLPPPSPFGERPLR